MKFKNQGVAVAFFRSSVLPSSLALNQLDFKNHFQKSFFFVEKERGTVTVRKTNSPML
jgi:hypothetical protein